MKIHQNPLYKNDWNKLYIPNICPSVYSSTHCLNKPLVASAYQCFVSFHFLVNVKRRGDTKYTAKHTAMSTRRQEGIKRVEVCVVRRAEERVVRRAEQRVVRCAEGRVVCRAEKHVVSVQKSA